MLSATLWQWDRGKPVNKPKHYNSVYITCFIYKLHKYVYEWSKISGLTEKYGNLIHVCALNRVQAFMLWFMHIYRGLQSRYTVHYKKQRSSSHIVQYVDKIKQSIILKHPPSQEFSTCYADTSGYTKTLEVRYSCIQHMQTLLGLCRH